jgi:tetratricopeptide (TPR) repeat protein
MTRSRTILRARSAPALAAALALLVTPVALAEVTGEPPLMATGRFLAPADSLGFTDYPKLPPQDQLARREQAKEWVHKGEKKEAVLAQHDFATAAGLCPYLGEAWLAYAESQQQLGNYEAASRCLNFAGQTLHYEPNEKRRQEQQARYQRLSAITAYNLGDSEGSLAHAQEVLRDAPGDAEMLLLSARALVALRRHDEARGALARIDPSGIWYARALAVRGLLEMNEGRLAQAEETFRKADEHGMRGPIFENDRGRLMLEMKRPQEAAERFRAAVTEQPTFMEARNNLAVAQRRAGDLDAAQATLMEAMELNPGYGAAHFNLAELCRERLPNAAAADRAALTQQALAHYQKALDLGYKEDVVLERGSSMALLSGDLATAERMLLKRTEKPDATGQVYYLLGRVKKQQGQLQIAQRLYQMALDRGYGEAVVHSDLGEVMLRQNDLAGARLEFERALAINSNLVVTRVNLCVALRTLGELQRADEVLRRAEQLAPNDHDVQQQRAELRKQGVH